MKQRGDKINKVCKCGKVHTEIPTTAVDWNDDGVVIGYMWNCDCHSTLFVPTFDLSKIKQLIFKGAI